MSRRFHDLIIRIVHTRLLLAASLKEHKLILECYHPSSKNTEPYLFCDYLGTPGLSNDKEGEGSAYTLGDGIGHLGRLGGLYSRFRPIRPEAEQRVFRSHPAGDVPGRPDSSTMFGNQPSRVDEATLCHEALVSHSVNLDSHELFSQLCVVTNLVQLGPRRGVFFSFVNVADGVVRIWREWLADRARKDGKELSEIDSSDQCGRVSDDAHLEARTLWVDSRKNVGVRVRIKEREWRRDAPILLHRNEDPAVSYAMEYEGKRARYGLEIFLFCCG